MISHIHLVIGTNKNPLQDILRDFKKFTSKKILISIEENIQESRKEWLLMIFRYHAKQSKRNEKYQFWTHENHAVELIDNTMIDSRVYYIHQNPVRAGIVKNEENYIYSSASNYASLESILEIELV